MPKKRVLIVGAGPGGLTAGMILASKGYQVDIYEKQPTVGGRNACLELPGGYRFDLGPTFLMMKFILEEVFALTGRDVHDYLEFYSIDPLYRLVFGDGRVLLPTRKRERMQEQLERFSPGSWNGYLKFLEYEEEKFNRLVPCLQVPYSTAPDFLKWRLARALPYLDVHKSLFAHLGRYFKDDDLKIAFTFQAKYLGMSPWQCPGLFSIIGFIEHRGGIYHPKGGLNRISHAMAKVIEEERGSIHLGRPVAEVLTEGGRANGLRLADGEVVRGDHVIINADFAHAMKHLVDPNKLRGWTPQKIERAKFSCSTFMLYLGVNRTYPDVLHHNIIFADDYKQNVREIAEQQILSESPSIYIQNASVTDPTLAPPGKSTIYILVPITNNRSGIDWPAERQRYRDKVLDIAEQRGGLKDLRKHIEAEAIITPREWEVERDVHLGATFNLGHGLDQMLYFRPHNHFEELGCYLVGGGTHPGSGLPTIYESGRISAGLIMKQDAWYV